MRPALTAPRSDHWDDVLDAWGRKPHQALWRAHSDAINRRLLEGWVPTNGVERALKTDLFDEAAGEGLYPLLASRAGEVTGIDVSEAVVHAALARHLGLNAVVADVLELPFQDEHFDLVVSNSTLDHFDSLDKLVAAIGELARVLSPRGELVITLDNRVNPVVALRTARPLRGLMRRLHVVPYFVGATCGPRRLARFLAEAGFEVQAVTAVMHAPPQVAAALASALARGGPPDRSAHVRRMLAFERLDGWPTRYLTGHFVAAKAVKR